MFLNDFAEIINHCRNFAKIPAPIRELELNCEKHIVLKLEKLNELDDEIAILDPSVKLFTFQQE